MRYAIGLFASLIVCLISVGSQAAEISCGPDLFSSGDFDWSSAVAIAPSGIGTYHPFPNASQCVGLLKARIVEGDYEKVMTVLKANPRLSEFVLDSPGGNVDEALKIGRLFRRQLIGTESEQAKSLNHVCASSCAFIWFGGVGRVGTVGVHRIKSGDPVAFGAQAPSDASALYRRWTADVNAYLNEMEIPQSIIELTLNTSSNEISFVEAEQDGLTRPPSIAEWEDATCGPPPNDYGNVYYSSCIWRLLSSRRKRLDNDYWYLALGAAIICSIWPLARVSRRYLKPVQRGPQPLT
jgi:hypothetical protein